MQILASDVRRERRREAGGMRSAPQPSSSRATRHQPETTPLCKGVVSSRCRLPPHAGGGSRVYRGAGPPIEAISSAVRHFAFELLRAASRARKAHRNLPASRQPTTAAGASRRRYSLLPTIHPLHHPVSFSSSPPMKRERSTLQRSAREAARGAQRKEEACAPSHTPPHWREPFVPGSGD